MFNAHEMKRRLVQSGIASPDHIRGCTHMEVESLERCFGLELPSAYKDFLYSFGHSAGGFWRDLEFTLDKLEWNNREMREILAELEEVDLTLPQKGFVFGSRHGEQFLFFLADGKNQNPPIYHFLIGYSEFRKACDTFWEAIEGELEICEQAYKDVPPGIFPWMRHC
ncbi:MAG: SMI1/KNR4 family protein [Zavarzinella sp.]